MQGSVEHNIRLYPYYRAAADALAWLPIFFLYFSERLSLAEVLLLEAVYYIAVVLIEVPSGYLSDVVGRRKTLLLSCLSIIAAYLFFLSSNDFLGLAIGQALLATSIAARSGTDTAFHYESLKAANRADEFGDREALAGKYGFAATAIAALAGGVVGSIDLVLPYWLSLLSAVVATIVAFRFVEPTGPEPENQPTLHTKRGISYQLAACKSYLTKPLLRWLLLYSVFMFAIVHIPYEFYQPYLALLETADKLAGISATLLAGILFSLTAVVASIASAYSMKLQRKIGLIPLLTWASAIELGIIASMAVLLHPLIAASVILRSGPMAVINAPINAAKAPLIDNAHRATYLSLESLLARLVFAILLFSFSTLVTDGNAASWDSLSTLLRVSAIAGFVGLLLLVYSSLSLRASIPPTPQNEKIS